MKCTNFTFKGEEGLDIYTYKWEDENIKKTKGSYPNCTWNG
ncbi:hypothetical protein [Clostridioides difficile]|nr:hypothetical protein [Clostridioides difficile]